MLELISIIIMIFSIFVYVFIVTDRICRCIEHCVLFRAYAECQDSDFVVKEFDKLGKGGSNE